jgi:peptidoglycan-N-acetylglucosamine deacetylase
MKCLPALLYLSLASATSAMHAAHAAPCAPDALGTTRTLTLPREAAAYGTVQHGPLALNKGEVVLTFDDGPEPGTVDRVLAALAAECVQATFFMTGSNLERHPDLGRRVAAAGHTPALHSFAHPQLGSLAPADQLADLDKGLAAFSAAFGTRPAAYRFPFLQETPTLLAALKEKRMTVASIDLGILDWAPNDMRTATLTGRLAQELDRTGGGILLMHDANGPTADALPALLRTIKGKGYKVVHLRWEDAAAPTPR